MASRASRAWCCIASRPGPTGIRSQWTPGRSLDTGDPGVTIPATLRTPAHGGHDPSNEMRTWTFKVRPGVTFHENWGELTAEDVKFTVDQSFKPDALGGSAYFFRNHLDRIETPDKHAWA
ncbi:MAG TPA: ABC transporter substrate-binding protein [Methylomirabilota bacterium]|nr:ABC transporter substrate-binding protein [Methylomirabilota bacterium]